MSSAPLPPPKDQHHSRSKTVPISMSTEASHKRVTTTASHTTAVAETDRQTLTSIPEIKQEARKSKQGVSRSAVTVTPVQVCVRVRPVTTTEALKKDNSVCVDVLKQTNTIRLKNTREKPPYRDFTFDATFSIEQSQQSVYETMVSPLISKCMDGYNGCIFAYGQTASGKTYTMQGPPQPTPDQYGIIQRVAIQIINNVEERRKKDNSVEFTLKVSYMEIYNEKLVDLLTGQADQSELKIRQEQDGSGLYVQGLTERGVGTLKEIMNVHASGMKNRTVAETNMNEASSRSHAIFSIFITEKRKDIKTDRVIKKTSKINIIDLAGSERAESTGATGARLKEGAAINLSLSALGNVINALSKPLNERGHVPYRDSMLTYLLSDSLGGNSLTLMITCLSPTLSNYDESLSTLRFAERVKKIKNNAKINMDPLMLRILELESELDEMRKRALKCTCGAMEHEAVNMAICSTMQMKTASLWKTIKLSFGKRAKVLPMPPEKDTGPAAIDKDTPPIIIKATKEM